MANFEDVKRVFGRVYRELCVANGEAASNSFTWYATTLEELEEEYGRELPRIDIDRCVGSGPIVAWLYECNGRTVATVGAEATEAEIEEELRFDMGFMDTFSDEALVRCHACGELVPAEAIADRLVHDTGGEVQCLACHQSLIRSDSDLACRACEV